MVEVAAVETKEKKGFFGKKQKNSTTIDGAPATPATIPAEAYDDRDDLSASSSNSGRRNLFGKAAKKPRAEYQKEIDALTEENKELKKHNAISKKEFIVLKNWAMSPPLPGTKQVADVVLTDESSESDDVSGAAVRKTKLFGKKKPRAEYQLEIDALVQENERLKHEIKIIKRDARAIKEWAKKMPMPSF